MKRNNSPKWRFANSEFYSVLAESLGILVLIVSFFVGDFCKAGHVRFYLLAAILAVLLLLLAGVRLCCALRAVRARKETDKWIKRQ